MIGARTKCASRSAKVDARDVAAEIIRRAARLAGLAISAARAKSSQAGRTCDGREANEDDKTEGDHGTPGAGID